MKKFKKIFMLVLVAIFTFMGVKNVNAETPQKFILNKGAEINAKNFDFSSTVNFVHHYTSDGVLVFCTSGRAIPTVSGHEYVRIDGAFNDEVAAGLAAIISNGVGINSNKDKYPATSQDYFATQVAIWSYLASNNLYNNSGDNDISWLESKIKEKHSTYIYKKIYGGFEDGTPSLLSFAATAANKAKEINNFSISLNSTNLTFTKNGNYYESNPIKVTGTYLKPGTVTYSIMQAPANTKIEGNNNSGYVVKVPVENIKDLSSSIQVKFGANSESYPIIKNYKDDNDNSNQNTTIVLTDLKNNNDETNISGTISVTPTLTIKKVDSSNNLIDGATVKVTGPGNFSKQVAVTKGQVSIPSSELTYGKYCVSEVTAPTGYVKAADPECKTLSATNPSATITITNKQTQVTFSKTDAVTGQALPGATLQILDKDKKALECANCKWTSGTGIHTIKGLPIGTYYLKEVSAPEGYILNSELIKFDINKDGTVVSENKNGSNIVMENIKISTSFLKIDAGTDKPLAGATLQILDKDKNVILDDSGKAKYEWVSTTKAYIIDGLAVGTYYLKEVSAPEGYSLNSELIEFTINSDGSVVSKNQNNKETDVIIMENKKTVTSFSKQDATTGKELPGATLQILDKDKKEIKDKDGKVLYKWVSTDKPHIIEGLPVGTYYLKETIQPKGYELNEELVPFEVTGDGKINKVIMLNTPVVEVPDTASAKSILLIVLGSLIGIGGIALIIYTIIKRKNSKI